MQPPQHKETVKGRALLIVPGQGFSYQEYSTVKSILEEDRIEVRTTSWAPGPAVSAEGPVLQPDLPIEGVDVSEWDAVVFLDGPGVEEYAESESARQLAQKAWVADRIIAAIGPAARIVAGAGLAQNNRLAAAESERPYLTGKGATVVDGIALRDGNLITGRDSSVAESFAHLVSGAIQSLVR